MHTYGIVAVSTHGRSLKPRDPPLAAASPGRIRPMAAYDPAQVSTHHRATLRRSQRFITHLRRNPSVLSSSSMTLATRRNP